MRKNFYIKWEKKKNSIIVTAGILLLIMIAVFCFQIVKKAIIESEQERLESLAKVNAQSLEASIEAKADMIEVAFSGNMDDEMEIQQEMIKVEEKGEYIPLVKLQEQQEWQKQICNKASKRAGEVVVGPIRKSAQGYYSLFMTKAIYMNEKLTGYVQIEYNLDELYEQEPALSSLQLANEGYCVVKNVDGITIMPSNGNQVREEFRINTEEGNGCVIARSYVAEMGTLKETKRMVAYETITVEEEKLVIYIVNDYDQMIQPIERIALYFCVLGIVILLWLGYFVYKITAQKKEEAQLLRELEHEKELNRANDALKKQENLMEKYNHSKTMEVLTGAIAHEFNNLMTPIMLYADLMEENEIVSNQMEEEIRELKSTAQRCEELAHQLLSYSRQGRAEKVLTEYNATFAIREAVNIIQKLVPSNVQLKTNICKTSYYLKGQVGSLNQILLNLTTNAIHAMKEGGILMIQFGLSTEDNNVVRLIVEDTGTGIPYEIQRNVFHPFFSTKPAGEGTGIGLTVVNRLTQEHGGSIRAKSEEGKGTRFILDFPRVNNS